MLSNAWQGLLKISKDFAVSSCDEACYFLIRGKRNISLIIAFHFLLDSPVILEHIPQIRFLSSRSNSSPSLWDIPFPTPAFRSYSFFGLSSNAYAIKEQPFDLFSRDRYKQRPFQACFRTQEAIIKAQRGGGAHNG